MGDRGRHSWLMVHTGGGMRDETEGNKKVVSADTSSKLSSEGGGEL